MSAHLPCRPARGAVALRTALCTALCAVLFVTSAAGCGSDRDPKSPDGDTRASTTPTPAPTADRVVQLTMIDGAFDDFAPGTFRPNAEVRFEMRNRSSGGYTLEVVAPDGRTLGRSAEAPAGGSAEATVTLASPGTYRILARPTQGGSPVEATIVVATGA